jgi:hypothetical protein
MKFSDLPENSWEKVMYKVVDFIGGDAPSLCNWNDEVPTPEKVAEEIVAMFAYMDDTNEDKFIASFREYCKAELK